MTALISYSQEIVPKFMALNTAKEILKDGLADDPEVLRIKDGIAALQDDLKSYVENKEAQLVREIKDLETDIKLACKAASKGTQFKAADLKGFFSARAKLSVSKVIEKGDMFAELDKELA